MSSEQKKRERDANSGSADLARSGYLSPTARDGKEKRFLTANYADLREIKKRKRRTEGRGISTGRRLADRGSSFRARCRPWLRVCGAMRPPREWACVSNPSDTHAGRVIWPMHCSRKNEQIKRMRGGGGILDGLGIVASLCERRCGWEEFERRRRKGRKGAEGEISDETDGDGFLSFKIQHLKSKIIPRGVDSRLSHGKRQQAARNPWPPTDTERRRPTVMFNHRWKTPCSTNPRPQRSLSRIRRRTE